MDLIDFPFRLVGSSVATIDQESSEASAMLLGVLMMTRRGERQMVPMFGVNDPTFDTYDQSDVQLGIDLFGPRVSIHEFVVTYPADGLQEVTVHYDDVQ